MKARELLDGTYRVWRRTLGDHAVLRPTPEMTAVFVYCFAVACLKSGAILHAVTVGLTGYEAIFTVTKDALPIVMAEANRNLAMVLKEMFTIHGPVWADQAYEHEEIKPDEIVRALAEIFVTPVRDALVHRPELWPGLNTYRVPFGTTFTAKRPEYYFDPEGDLPAVASVATAVPPALADRSEEAIRELIGEQVAKRCAEIKETLTAENKKPIGVERALRADPFARQVVVRIRGRKKGEREEYQSQKQRGRRVSRGFLARWNDFLERYHEALAAWCAGNREIEFPRGTYWLRYFHHARCEGG